MKRIFPILMAGLLLGADEAARAQETNSSPTLDWSYFEPITKKNIFDPSRSRRGSRDVAERIHIPVIRTFTYRGTMDDRAIFTGEGVPLDGCAKVGDLINGFKVMQVTIDFVKLAEPNGDLLVLQTDDSMRREDEAPWAKSDQPPPPPSLVAGGIASNSDSAPGGNPGVSDTNTVAEPAGLHGADREAEILRRLRMKREQENK
jgi:hypothetical protein